MAWLRLDDSMLDHPKIVGLSDGAHRLHINGLLYAAKHLTDGQLRKAVVATLAERVGGPGDGMPYVEELVAARLWDRGPEGVIVLHGFLEKNPTRAQWEKDQRANAERAARSRGRKKKRREGTRIRMIKLRARERDALRTRDASRDAHVTRTVTRTSASRSRPVIQLKRVLPEEVQF